MHAGRGATRLLLVAAFAVAVTGFARQPRSKRTRQYRRNKDALQLLDHVMLHEEQWTDVLQEPVVRLGDPPHKGRAFIGPKLEPIQSVKFDKGPVYNAHDLVATVTIYYRTVRSFTEYAARALRRALACYTFKQLRFQSKSMSMMISKKADPEELLSTAYDLKKNTPKFIDIMSAVPDDDLSILMSVYWDVIKDLQYKGVQHTDKPEYPTEVKDAMKKLYEMLDVFLGTSCLPYETDEVFYRMTGVPRRTPMLRNPSLEMMIPVETLESVTKTQAAHMSRIARRIGNLTLPGHLWASLFLYSGLPWPDSTVMDVESPEKRGEVTPGTSEAGPSKEPPPAE